MQKVFQTMGGWTKEKMRIKRIALCFVLAASCFACGHGKGSLEDLLVHGRIDEVLRVSSECLDQSPKEVKCLEYKARALEAAARPGEAIDVWETLLDVDRENADALQRLIDYAKEIPRPRLGLLVLERSSAASALIPEGQREEWEASIRETDKILGQARICAARGMVYDSAELLRQALDLDGARIDIRTELSGILIRTSGRGLNFSERVSPLREGLSLAEDRFLNRSAKDQLKELRENARIILEDETETYREAVDYVPYARAPFEAIADSTRYFSTMLFRCDDSQYADIWIEFPPGEGRYVIVGTSAEILSAPDPSASVIGVIRGSAGMVILEKGPLYSLVSVGETKGWVRSDKVVEKNRFRFELEPRGSTEFRTSAANAKVRVEVNGSSFFRGEIKFSPYIHYRWSF